MHNVAAANPSVVAKLDATLHGSIDYPAVMREYEAQGEQTRHSLPIRILHLLVLALFLLTVTSSPLFPPSAPVQPVLPPEYRLALCMAVNLPM